MLYRITRIEENVVRISTENGGYFDISLSELDFEPTLGDEVSVYFNNGQRCIILEKRAANTAIVKTNVDKFSFETDNPFKVEQNKSFPILVCVLSAIVLVAAGIYYYVDYRNKRTSEYANNLLSTYRKLQDVYFQKYHEAGYDSEIGLRVDENSDFKVEGDRSFFKLTSLRNMRGCPQGTTWTIRNSVTRDYWRTETADKYQHHYKWTIHYACSMLVHAENSEDSPKFRKNCEWFVPEFKSICKNMSQN